MGKLISKPKMPALPALPPLPVPEPVVEAPKEAEQPEQTEEEMRVQTLLARRRGRLGTVATSLRGVLSDTGTPAANTPIRKTLLGD